MVLLDIDLDRIKALCARAEQEGFTNYDRNSRDAWSILEALSEAISVLPEAEHKETQEALIVAKRAVTLLREELDNLKVVNLALAGAVKMPTPTIPEYTENFEKIELFGEKKDELRSFLSKL